MWDHDGDARLNQEEFTDMLRSLDVDVDDTVKGRQSLISIAKTIGVASPLVTFEQVLYLYNYTPKCCIHSDAQ
jgi:hypothetical protein